MRVVLSRSTKNDFMKSIVSRWRKLLAISPMIVFEKKFGQLELHVVLFCFYVFLLLITSIKFLLFLGGAHCLQDEPTCMRKESVLFICLN